MRLYSLLRLLKDLDWVLLGAILILNGFTILSFLDNKSLLIRQILFVFVAFTLAIALSFFNYNNFRNSNYLVIILYLLGVISLGGLFVFGSRIRGSLSWYSINGLTLQPVELMKVALILINAKYFSIRHVELYRFKHIAISLFYVLLPSILILMQPDFGSALIFSVIWIGIILVAGIKTSQFLGIIAGIMVLLVVFWNFFLAGYQKDRIINFINPENDPMGSGYQTIQSLIAVGNGGIIGQGILNGTQTRLGFLPESRTDFIFASIAEESGFFGGSTILILYLILFWRLYRITINTSDNFSRLFIAGGMTMVFSQILLGFGMNLGFLPVIGIPIPFLSYGGSNLISLFIFIGITQSIIRFSRKRYLVNEYLEV